MIKKKKAAKRPKKEKLNAGHYHEALDRSYLTCDFIQTALLDHPCISQHPKYLAKATKAQELIGALYQQVGADGHKLFSDE